MRSVDSWIRTLERHRYLSVILDPGLAPDEIQRLVRIAVASGVRSLWFRDSNDDWRSFSPSDPWQLAVSIASDQQEVFIGLMFDTLWWPPGLIGSMAARLNAAMEGRLNVGITAQSELAVTPLPAAARVQAGYTEPLTYMQYSQQVREVISGGLPGPARRPPVFSIRITQSDQVAAVVKFADTAVIPFTDLSTVELRIRALENGCRVWGRVRSARDFAVEVPVVLGRGGVLNVPVPGPTTRTQILRDTHHTVGADQTVSTTVSRLRGLGVDEIRYWAPRTVEMADILVAIGDV